MKNIIYFSPSFPIHFNACFPLKKRKIKTFSSKSNTWITQGIRTSCKKQRTLYFISKHHNVSPGSIYTSENIKEF